MLLNVKGLSIDLATQRGTLSAVQDVSFHVDKGETLCIVGESGCGKSITALSLLRLLPASARLTAETISFNDLDLLTLPEADIRPLRGNRLSMIFQDPMSALNPLHTVGRQLTDVLLAHQHVTRAKATERACELLLKVGIPNPEERLQQYPHELSGGLRQRIVIAMALMCEPELIIADEPTTALDVTIQADLLRLLKELQQALGMGMIFITHDLGLVSRIADRIVVMYAGEVVEAGPASAIFEHPAHPYTRALLGAVPDPSHPRMEPLESIPGTVPSLLSRDKTCHFRGRCPMAQDICNNRISLQTVGADHQARCIRVGAEDSQ